MRLNCPSRSDRKPLGESKLAFGYYIHTEWHPIGEWTSPGDSGNGRGIFTPEWWSDSVNQYGMLKVLRITNEGTFIDGQHLSDITLADIPVERNQWTIRLSVEEDAQHVAVLPYMVRDSATTIRISCSDCTITIEFFKTTNNTKRTPSRLSKAE